MRLAGTGRRRAMCGVIVAATAAQLVQQQRVEPSRCGIVRFVLQNQPTVLQRLRVMPFHDRRQELRRAQRTGVWFESGGMRYLSQRVTDLGEILARRGERVVGVGIFGTGRVALHGARPSRRQGRRRARVGVQRLQAEVSGSGLVARLVGLPIQWRRGTRAGKGHHEPPLRWPAAVHKCSRCPH